MSAQSVEVSYVYDLTQTPKQDCCSGWVESQLNTASSFKRTQLAQQDTNKQAAQQQLCGLRSVSANAVEIPMLTEQVPKSATTSKKKQRLQL